MSSMKHQSEAPSRGQVPLVPLLVHLKGAPCWDVSFHTLSLVGTIHVQRLEHKVVLCRATQIE
jgi:hypothetical protein